MALVTIGIPVYNEEHYLAAAIESVLSQTFNDFDLVICDNCSSDSSLAIAKSYATRDSRVRVIQHPKNIGAPRNFLSCRDAARSPYFCWLGAHDMFKQEWLSAALAALEVSPDIAMVYPKYATYIDSGGRYFEEGIYAGAHSCSEIDTAGIEDPIARATHVIKSLGMCTNFHGLFRTDIAKHLPLKSVLAFDVLVLATATLYGHIRSVSVEGIQRRVVRARESNDERHDRYTSVGLALRADKLIGLHLWYAVLSMQGGVASWVRHGAEFKDALEFKFGTHSPHMQFLKAIKDRPNFIGIPFLLYRFVRSPTSLLHRPTLGALKSRLRGNA